MWFIFLLVIGLALGSFLNVVIFRFKEEQFLLGTKVLGGRSKCPHCHRTLAWYELVPVVSFVVQLGRCRTCGHRLSFQYPLVEIAAAILTVAPAYYFFKYKWLFYAGLFTHGESWAIYVAVAIWIYIFIILLLLSVIDFREYLIPDAVLWLLGVGGVLWVTLLSFSGLDSIAHGSFVGEYATLFGLWDNTLINHLLGASVGALVIALIFFLSRGRAIGFGDVILLGVLGFLFGYPDVVLILVLSFLIGAGVSLILIARRKKGMQDFVPFAPFIALASFITFFFGSELLHYYFIVFNPFG